MKVEQDFVNDESGHKPKRIFEDTLEAGSHRPQLYVAPFGMRWLLLMGPNLCASPKLVDLPAIPLRGAAKGRRREVHHGPALFGNFSAGCATGVGFPVEGLGNDGGATNVAELQNLDFEFGALGFDLKHVPHVDFACRLRRLLVGLDASEFASTRGHGPRLEETGGPEPFIETKASH